MSLAKADPPAIDYERLKRALEASKNDDELFHHIVDAPFEQIVEAAHMFLGIIVLRLVNKQTRTIDHMALSNTELAKDAKNVTVVPFKEIKIPLKTRGNVIALAAKTGEPQDTADWRFLFHPVLDAEQSRINQASAGIAYSAVYPFQARDGGALIFSYYQYEEGVGDAQHEFMARYSQMVDACLKSQTKT